VFQLKKYQIFTEIDAGKGITRNFVSKRKYEKTCFLKKVVLVDVFAKIIQF
jgi:hypothetical protein